MKHLTVTLLILSIACIAAAQRKPPARPAPSFDWKPFDIGQERLPATYRGHPVAALFVMLHARVMAERKDEFETTVDHAKRVQRLRSVPMLAGIKLNSLLAFSLVTDDSQLTTHYDADRSVLDIRLSWANRGEVGVNSYLSYDEETFNGGSYVGRNAFNRAVRVQVFKKTEYLVAAEGSHIRRIKGTSQTSFSFTPPFILTSISMSPPEAMAAKENLRALLIGTLRDRAVWQSFNRETPTIDSPVDVHMVHNTVYVVPFEIWFYDYASGRVYSKFRRE